MKTLKCKPLLTGTLKAGRSFSVMWYITKKYYGIKWIFFSRKTKCQIVNEMVGA